MVTASDSPSTLVADIQLPEGPRAPFIARRVVRAIITDAPASRSVDAALLVSEVVTLMVEPDVTLSVRIEEVGAGPVSPHPAAGAPSRRRMRS